MNVKGELSLLMTDCTFHQAQISPGCSGCSVTYEWKLLVILRIVIRYKNTMKCLLHRSIHNPWNDHLAGAWLFVFFMHLVNNTFNKPKHFSKAISFPFPSWRGNRNQALLIFLLGDMISWKDGTAVLDILIGVKIKMGAWNKSFLL